MITRASRRPFGFRAAPAVAARGIPLRSRLASAWVDQPSSDARTFIASPAARRRAYPDRSIVPAVGCVVPPVVVTCSMTKPPLQVLSPPPANHRGGQLVGSGRELADFAEQVAADGRLGFRLRRLVDCHQ